LRRERRARRRGLHVERQRAALRDLLLVLEIADRAFGFQLLVAIAFGAGLIRLRADAVDLRARVDGRQRGSARVELGQDLSGLDLLAALDRRRQHRPLELAARSVSRSPRKVPVSRSVVGTSMVLAASVCTATGGSSFASAASAGGFTFAGGEPERARKERRGEQRNLQA